MDIYQALNSLDRFQSCETTRGTRDADDDPANAVDIEASSTSITNQSVGGTNDVRDFFRIYLETTFKHTIKKNKQAVRAVPQKRVLLKK